MPSTGLFEILFIAALVSAKMGDLNVIGVLIAVLLSALSLDWFFFFIGRKQGQPFVDKRPKLKTKINKMDDLMEKHPIGLLLVYRYLFGFRIAIPIMLGISHYSAIRFLLISTFGAIIWVSIFGYLGYFCANQIITYLDFVKENIWIFLLSVLCIGILYRWYSKKGEMKDCIDC